MISCYSVVIRSSTATTSSLPPARNTKEAGCGKEIAGLSKDMADQSKQMAGLSNQMARQTRTVVFWMAMFAVMVCTGLAAVCVALVAG